MAYPNLYFWGTLVLFIGMTCLAQVFGHDLGSGAFSTVKYARLITKGKTRYADPRVLVHVSIAPLS
jgi:hypothetical protein